MSEIKEILTLLKLGDSIKKEYKEKAAEISRGEFPEGFEIEQDKKIRTLLNTYIEKDTELSKFNHENDKENFEKVFTAKYEKEFYRELEAFVDQMIEEYFEPYSKKLEEIDRKLVESPTKSLLLASSLHYGRKTAAGAKKIGGTTGKFVGSKIKDGTLYLWDNKEEIRDKLVDVAMKREEAIEKERKKLESEYARLKVIYEKYSNKELLNIVRDENEKGINRRTAQRILKARK